MDPVLVAAARLHLVSCSLQKQPSPPSLVMRSALLSVETCEGHDSNVQHLLRSAPLAAARPRCAQQQQASITSTVRHASPATSLSLPRLCCDFLAPFYVFSVGGASPRRARGDSQHTFNPSFLLPGGGSLLPRRPACTLAAGTFPLLRSPTVPPVKRIRLGY